MRQGTRILAYVVTNLLAEPRAIETLVDEFTAKFALVNTVARYVVVEIVGAAVVGQIKSVERHFDINFPQIRQFRKADFNYFAIRYEVRKFWYSASKIARFTLNSRYLGSSISTSPVKMVSGA